MIAKILSATVIGLDAELIEVEADVTNGLTNTVIVGLPDTSVQESKERVKSAIKNSGASYPFTRVSLNLAPADVPKLGTHFDLSIALAILIASEQIFFKTNNKLFLGELSLDGKLRQIPGALAIVIKAKEAGITEIFLPEGNAQEAAFVTGVKIFPVGDLKSLIAHLMNLKLLFEQVSLKPEDVLSNTPSVINMKDVSGQEIAKRALEIAASGGHNILSLCSQSGIPIRVIIRPTTDVRSDIMRTSLNSVVEGPIN